jgi:hypothetical protein
MKLEVFSDARLTRTVDGTPTECIVPPTEWFPEKGEVWLDPEIGYLGGPYYRSYLCKDVTISVEEWFEVVALDKSQNNLAPSELRVATYITVNFNDGDDPFGDDDTRISVGKFDEVVSVNGTSGTQYTLPFEVNNIPGVTFQRPVYTEFFTSYYDAT